ncbi:MAG: Ppx/GppA family phosphatase [Bacillota bacterium]
MGMVVMDRVAVIDIGTNSTRLLVAEVSAGGEVKPLLFDMEITRLGEGIQGGKLLEEPSRRTVEAVSRMEALARKWSVSAVAAAATSAVRDAANREWFLGEVFKSTGIRVRVLDGDEEAFYNWLGVGAGFGGDMSSAAIVDIGGGSTEFTWEREGGLSCLSVRAGAVRMTEGGHSEREIFEILGAALDRARDDGISKVIGVGGTITTLAAMDMRLEEYDRSLVHGYFLSRGAIMRLLDLIVGTGPEERKRIPGLQPARADIIEAGTCILLAVVNGLGIDGVTVSEADLMYGLALKAAEPVETKSAAQTSK